MTTQKKVTRLLLEFLPVSLPQARLTNSGLCLEKAIPTLFPASVYSDLLWSHQALLPSTQIKAFQEDQGGCQPWIGEDIHFQSFLLETFLLPITSLAMVKNVVTTKFLSWEVFNPFLLDSRGQESSSIQRKEHFLNLFRKYLFIITLHYIILYYINHNY